MFFHFFASYVVEGRVTGNLDEYTKRQSLTFRIQARHVQAFNAGPTKG